jgi:hypothetical protein
MQESNLEWQWKQYLKRVDVTEEQLSPIQRQEMKRAFYGACGQILILLRDDVGELPEDQAVTVLQDMMNQIQNFWQGEITRQN